MTRASRHRATADPADTDRPSDQPASDHDGRRQDLAAGSEESLRQGERDRARAAALEGRPQTR